MSDSNKGETMSELPTIDSYGQYSSANYGAHTLQVNMGGVMVWFSYKTPVAFVHPKRGRIVHKNVWGTTTGKHLNWIDGGNKKDRVDADTFESLWQDVFPAEKQ